MLGQRHNFLFFYGENFFFLNPGTFLCNLGLQLKVYILDEIKLIENDKF